MKKKVLAALLSATMIMSLAACGGDDASNNNAATPTDAPKATEAPAAPTEAPVAPTEAPAAPTEEPAPAGPTIADAEPLPDAPFAHITFDSANKDAEGYFAVTQVEKAADSIMDGATYDIAASDSVIGFANGPVGECAYIDGKFGIDLNLQPTNTDAYTVSFWMNADRLSTFGATLQMGYNMGRAADAGNNVTWFNVTQSEWGANSAKIFPIVWSRNEASDAADGTDCWPWMYGWDDSIHGKREWVHVTIVASGEEQAGPTGATTCGAQYYINGAKVYDSQDNFTNGTYFEYTWDATLAPNIMEPGDSEFESLFGINYWDTMYKGFVDDLYVYDTALTAGQVASLYALGDPSVESVAPEAGTAEPEPAEPVANDNSGVATTGTVIGSMACDTGFWSTWSDTVAVPSGESVSVNFKNWTNGLANWNNFLVILQNVADAHGADANPDYKEYAVMRADNWGWGSGYDGIAVATCDQNWDTFAADMNGADVALTITNNGTTADVVAVVTTAEGKVYNQSYTGIAVDGDLYYCLSCENAFLDIQ